MGIRLMVLVAGALLVSPAMASADQVEEAQRVALLYWADRGHSECEGLEVEVAYGGKFPGSALVGGCALARDCQTGVRENCYPDGADTAAYINLHEDTIGRDWVVNCTLVIHEYGHLVGLDHDSHWAVMRSGMATPNECRNPTGLRDRARRLERRSHRLAKRDHPRRARRFERRANGISAQADRAAEFRTRAGL